MPRDLERWADDLWERRVTRTLDRVGGWSWELTGRTLAALRWPLAGAAAGAAFLYLFWRLPDDGGWETAAPAVLGVGLLLPLISRAARFVTILTGTLVGLAGTAVFVTLVRALLGLRTDVGS